MMFLGQVSAQKLHETGNIIVVLNSIYLINFCISFLMQVINFSCVFSESLRSIQVCPRSISERIVHKFATINKKPADIRHNPYHELEAAYVAQICLTWEALNWNYKYFQRKLLASRRDQSDPGCPAHIAQQFQQFQVLLQRYIENEPYEQGRRPEVYARMRLLAPKLLLVPEYRGTFFFNSFFLITRYFVVRFAPFFSHYYISVAPLLFSLLLYYFHYKQYNHLAP